MAEPLRETNAWRRLEWHHGELAATTLRELFAADPSRGERLTAEATGLYLDFSKHLVTDDTLSLLRRLATERGLQERTRAMFRGERVNVSEDRAALHVALRMPASRSLVADGVDVVKQVHEELARMASLAGSLRKRAVVNIGIGGSDLGPAMAYEALRSHADSGTTVRFVSNVDPLDLDLALSGLDPAETLVVVVSKTFTTLETMENARRAQAWLGDAGRGNLVGVAASPERGEPLGIPPERMLRMWDWVGGRMSLWSAAGFSLFLALGEKRFRELLAGAHAMDEHFRGAALGGNLPAIHGLLSVWYRDFWGAQTTAVVPYSTALRLLPAYLQQLWMESNGKRVTAAGDPVDADTARSCGAPTGRTRSTRPSSSCTRGRRSCPSTSSGSRRRPPVMRRSTTCWRPNLVAQAQALAFGRTEDELRDAGAPEETIPHRVTPGNRPSSVLLAGRLDPATLGALLALYEHSVFTQAAIWDIDPFDQWGVELGKELAARIAPELDAGWKHELMHDSSTTRSSAATGGSAMVAESLELRAAPGALGRDRSGCASAASSRRRRGARRRPLPRLRPLAGAAADECPGATGAVPALPLAACRIRATSASPRRARSRSATGSDRGTETATRPRSRRAGRDRARRRLPGQPRPAPLGAVRGRSGRARRRARAASAAPRRPLVGDGWAIVSASPELFLARRGRRVWTMPIKGTRPLGVADELDGSEKDAAEHVMIVDLERNDLSRVCEPGSRALARADGERELAGVDAPRLDRRGHAARRASASPSCSRRPSPAARSPARRRSRRSTTSPRSSRSAAARRWARSAVVRANGDLDLALTIRTFAVADGRIHLWVGGGIVWDSDPEAEIEESWVKARPLLAASARRRPRVGARW